MHLPRALARFNRLVVNPFQRRYAGVIPGHGIIEHRGRRTGRTYRTPVLVFRVEDGFCIIVGYGLDSDWVRNLVAAGGGGLLHRRRRYTLSEPRILRGREAYEALPRAPRAVARLARVDGVLRTAAEPG